MRFVVDYRRLNAITVKNSYPIPALSDCLDYLQGNQVFSKLDAASGFWMIPMEEEDAPKTAFQTRYGLFEFTRMPFGLTNAPASFSAAVHAIFEDILYKLVVCYLDDIIIPSIDTISHFLALQIAFFRLQEKGAKLKPIKCLFFQRKIDVLGRIATGDSLAMSEKDIEVVKEWPTPKTIRDVSKFVGLASYHRQFVPNFATTARPLNTLLKKGAKFAWTDETNQAFNALKTALTSPPILGMPKPIGTFILDTDSSQYAMGAQLNQLQNEQERVISYASITFTATEVNYCATRRELLAVVYFCHYYRHYLLGEPFIVRTDHSSLTWLMNFKNAEGQLLRWINSLADYDMRVIHRKGELHGNADALSRLLLNPNHLKRDVPLEDLPCKGCSACRQAYSKLRRFYEDVDDVAPLVARVGPAEAHDDIDNATPLVIRNQPAVYTTPLPDNAPAFAFASPVRTRGKIIKLPKLLTIDEDEEYYGEDDSPTLAHSPNTEDSDEREFDFEGFEDNEPLRPVRTEEPRRPSPIAQPALDEEAIEPVPIDPRRIPTELREEFPRPPPQDPPTENSLPATPDPLTLPTLPIAPPLPRQNSLPLTPSLPLWKYSTTPHLKITLWRNHQIPHSRTTLWTKSPTPHLKVTLCNPSPKTPKTQMAPTGLGQRTISYRHKRTTRQSVLYTNGSQNQQFRALRN